MEHYKSVEFLSIFRMSSPSIEIFLAAVLSLLLNHLLSTRSPILPQWNKSLCTVLTCAVLAWPAQNFGGVKMFDFSQGTAFCL